MTKFLKCGLCDHLVKDSNKSDLMEHFKSAHKIRNESEKLNPTATDVAQDDSVSKDNTLDDSAHFKCAKCGTKFPQKQNLKNHLKRHMKDLHLDVKEYLSKDSVEFSTIAENEHQAGTNLSPIATDLAQDDPVSGAKIQEDSTLSEKVNHVVSPGREDEDYNNIEDVGELKQCTKFEHLEHSPIGANFAYDDSEDEAFEDVTNEEKVSQNLQSEQDSDVAQDPVSEDQDSEDEDNNLAMIESGTTSEDTRLENEDMILEDDFINLLSNYEFDFAEEVTEELLPHESSNSQNCQVKAVPVVIPLRPKNCTPSSSKKYVCNECESLFADQYSLKWHMRKVHRDNLCQGCDWVFSDKKNLKRHKEIAHVCKKCKMTFCQKKILREHEKSAHNMHKSKIKDYKCEQCGKGFSSWSYFKYHVNSVHPNFQGVLSKSVGLKRNTCKQCGRSFPEKSALKGHQERNITACNVCKLCSMTFCRKGDLIKHKKNVHDLNWCKECEISISTKKEMENHNKTMKHANAVAKKRFVYNSTDPLDKTLFGAVDPEPGDMRHWWDGCLYRCNICLEEFSEQLDITNHVRDLHRQERRDNMPKDNYSALKITYFNCKLCLTNGHQTATSGRRLNCRKSSIMGHLRDHHSLESLSNYEKLCKQMMKARKVFESSSHYKMLMVNETGRSGAMKSKSNNKTKRTKDPLNKTLFGAVNPGPGDKRHWWDGCMYQCNICLEEFPDSKDVIRHVRKAHRQEARDNIMKLNYSVMLTTYFNCKICLRTGSKHLSANVLKTGNCPGMRLKCRKSTIMGHLREHHSFESIHEYERLCKRMKS